jgi:Ca-activated chloride channel family protein
VEAALAANPALRSAVDTIRATADQLETALAAEPAPAHSAVVVPARPRARVVRFPVAYYIIGGLAAASFAVMVLRYEPPAHTAASAPEDRLVRLELEKTVPDADSETKAPEPTLAQAAAPEVKVELPRELTSADKVALNPPTIEVVPLAPPVEPTPRVEPPVSVAQAASASSTNTRPATPEVRTLAAPALARYDRNGNGRLDPDEIAAMQADNARAAARTQVASTAGDVVTLQPFEVDASRDIGYYAENTLAGSRLRTNIADLASSITVVTKQQLQDAGAQRVVEINDQWRAKEPNSAGGTAGFRAPPPATTESYAPRQDNAFIAVANEPLSTFSIDVDTAGYSNVRRFLQNGERPPRDAVRVEEMVNYFPYRYAPPTDKTPFAASLEVAAAPWEPTHRLVRIGLKGREMSQAARPAANLVFLLDVSGSMNAPNKLPLVKESLRLLVGKLRPDDRVGIVVYAGATGLALPSTPVAKSAEILAALDELRPGGGTNGGMGIQLAYDIAKANFVPGGVNRVILCTDGDFNVGVTSQGDLLRLIEEKAKSNVFLTVLGFGMGNLKDSTLELLADKGNGSYGYIDSRREAEKLLVEQAGGTLVTIAKDVKVQVEFNPAQVKAYRLVGYENRLLQKEDFNNDKIDAGEIGAGHTVTAFYELIPADADEKIPEISVDALKYQKTGAASAGKGASANPQSTTRTAQSQELLTVKIRYKEPTADDSKRLEFPLTDRGTDFAAASDDFRFAAAVAAFGLALREDTVKGSLLADSARWAESGLSDDPGGYRSEFVGLVRRAQEITR